MVSNGSRSVGYVLVCNKQFFKARFVTVITEEKNLSPHDFSRRIK